MDLVNHLEGRLLFAVPKKGRLQQPTLSLLEGSDIQFRRETRLDIALVKNLPLALIFLPAADIPTFVGEGRVDLGITGGDQVAEHDALLAKNRREQEGSKQGTPRSKGIGQKGLPHAQLDMDDASQDTPATESSIDLDGGTLDREDPQQDTNEGVEQVMDLGFGHCKLQAQAPERGHIHQPSQLIGKNVVTSFVGVTEQYFRDLEEAHAADDQDSLFEEREATPDFMGRIVRRKLRTRIKYVGGSVEAACALGVADGIVDLVESGETMKAAGLKAIATVLSSTAVLIKSRAPSNPSLVDLIANRIRGVITAQKYILCQYNIPRGLLDQGTKITPGKRAPTITALEDSDWVAVSSMVEKSRCALVMDELTGAGATDILVFGISNAR